MKSLLLLGNLLLLSFVCTYVHAKTTSVLRRWYWPSLLAHGLSGLAIGWLYTYYYKAGDTLVFFSEGVKLSELARVNFSSYLTFLWTGDGPVDFLNSLYYQNDRALFMVKLSSIANLLSVDTYWISSLYFSLLSFFASWKLSNTLIHFYPSKETSIIASFLILPSVVFWSSGIVKESIALATLYYILHVFLLFYKESKITWYRIGLLLVGTWLLFTLKYYYVAVLMPVLITTLLHQKLWERVKTGSLWLEFSLWFFIFACLSLGVTQLHPNFYLDRFLSVLYANYQDFIGFSQASDVMLFPSFQKTWGSVILLSPWAFFSGIFRPFLWESTNLFQVIASIENLILLLLTITALPSLRMFSKQSDRMLLLAALVYCFTLGTFLTLSTPNFGTLIRYRVGFLPIVVFLITATNPTFQYSVNFLSSWLKRLVVRKA